MNVIEILEELESDNSRLVKEEILRQNRDNELLKKVFVAALDPYIVYYVNKFKMPRACGAVPAVTYSNKYTESESYEDCVLEDFLDGVLPKLSSRQVTGNAAKALIEAAFSMMTELLQKWCQRIILKNLRCGVQDSTVNKTWPGTINGFKVALAETLKTSHEKGVGIKIEDQVVYPVRVEPKLDGLRCIAVKQNGIVTMYTRNGTVLDTLPKIKALLENASYDNIVIDAEGMAQDWNASASIMMSKKTKKDDDSIILNVFDCVPLADWISQKNDEKYANRLGRLSTIVSAINDEHVQQVQGVTVFNEGDLLKFYAATMEREFEGVMLKDLEAPYRFKRSDAILKMKPVTTYEGVVVGHYEGRRGTKREGLFGGFHVVLPNGIVTRLGGGFTDVLKAEVQLEGPDSFIGKIVEMEAQPDPMTSDGLTKDGRARFPVFCRFRNEADVDPSVIAAGQAFVANCDVNNE